MPDQIPYPHTSDLQAVNLVSTATHQFAVWYTLAGELRIGRIQRGVQQWGVNHQEYEFAGTPRTVLALPVADDDHNFPAVAVDGRGFLHVWANMHGNTLRAVTTTTAHTTGDWLATAGWVSAAAAFPSVDVRCTYPIPVHLADGSLMFYVRDGPLSPPSGAARSDSSIWTRTPQGTSWSAKTKLFQGLSVPGAGGPGPWPSGTPGADASVDDNSNWSPSICIPVVESPRHPHPGRLHLCWIWKRRDDVGYTQGSLGPGESAPADVDRTNDYPSYAYSDDNGTTWRAIDGTALTVPFTALNNTAARIGLQDTSVGYSSWSGLTIDDQGLPHIIVSTTPKWWIRRNSTNTAWTQTTIPNPLSGTLHTGGCNTFWVRGHLWMLNTGAPTGQTQRRQYMWRADDPVVTVTMSGYVNSTALWNPSADPEAYRRFGTIETLAPDGNSPQVYTFGNHTRRQAAA